MFIRYKEEVISRKGMLRGYKTSNRIGTDRRTAENGNTILKGNLLFSYFWKKGECGILSYKNNNRHTYDKRNEDTATKLNLPELEKSDRFSLSCPNEIAYCYDIYNRIAEHFTHPLAGGRKNSLFFVGSRMANVSAVYHTLLSTYHMNGLSSLEYLKKFFTKF